MELVPRISAILIAIIAYCAVGNCAETGAFFKYTENNQYYVQPFRNVSFSSAYLLKKKMNFLPI